MDKNKGNTILIAVVVVLVIIVIIWFVMKKPKSLDEKQVAFTDDSMTNIEKDMIASLATIDKININPEVFNNPAFAQLVDMSRRITEEPIHRANPFAPIDIAAILESQAQEENTQSSESADIDFNSTTLKPRVTE